MDNEISVPDESMAHDVDASLLALLKSVLAVTRHAAQAWRSSDPRARRHLLSCRSTRPRSTRAGLLLLQGRTHRLARRGRPCEEAPTV